LYYTKLELINHSLCKITIQDSVMSFQFNFTLEAAEESNELFARSGTLDELMLNTSGEAP